MSAIFEKLGIYDLFVNMLSGIFIVFSFHFLVIYVYDIERLLGITFNPNYDLYSFATFIFCFFIGMIFQEVANFTEVTLYRCSQKLNPKRFLKSFLLLCIPSIDRILMKSEDITKLRLYKLFGLRKKAKRDLFDSEIDEITEFIKKDKKTKKDESNEQENLNVLLENNDVIYEICKQTVLNESAKIKIDNDQSHASMARSLGVYSFIIFVLNIVIYCLGFNKIESLEVFWLLMVFSAFLFVMFTRRNKRFSEIRYVKIFRTYLYIKRRSILGGNDNEPEA